MPILVLQTILREVRQLATGNEEASAGERFDKILELIVGSVCMSLSDDHGRFHRAAILVPTADGQALRIRRGVGFSTDGERNFRASLGESFAGNAYQTRQGLYSSDVTKDPRWVRHPLATKEYRSLACLPIWVGGDVVGVLSVDAVEPGASPHRLDSF